MDLTALLLSFLILVAAKQEGALQFALHVPQAFLEQGIRSFNTHTHTLFLFPHLFPHTELFPTAQHHVEEWDYPSQGYVYLFSEMH